MLKLADSITGSQILNIGIEFDDNGIKRTTSINLPNFKDDLTEQQIKNAFANNNILIYGYDESTGEAIEQPITSDNVITASTTNQTINNLDIGWED